MIMTCKKCGFILGTRPGLLSENGICYACLNIATYKKLDWTKREQLLSGICKTQKEKKKDYDCIIAVSGGKDSTYIVKTLVTKYKMKPLLVTVVDEFTHTKAGLHNVKNIAERFNCDHITWRCEPQTFIKETKKDFVKTLHPLKWIEEKIYSVPVDIAKKFGVDVVFFGENSAFQYGTCDNLFHLHKEDGKVKVYYFFAFVKYDEFKVVEASRKYGFKDLDDFTEWNRHGNMENFTQIDSIAYIIQLWTKFVKFGFQRVSDMACRMVRSKRLTKKQAMQYIKDKDYICDPMAKKDFCTTIGITEAYFNEIVDKHANTKLVIKDCNGNWRRKDLI